MEIKDKFWLGWGLVGYGLGLAVLSTNPTLGFGFVGFIVLVASAVVIVKNIEEKKWKPTN